MDRPRAPETLPTLLGRRVTLRRVGEGDLDALLEIFGDPRVSRFMGIPRLKDRDGARALLRDIDLHARRQTLLQWGVCRTGAGEPEELATPDRAERLIGTCTLADVDWRNRRAELGFALGPAHWGRGYMGEALVLLLDHAVGTLRLHRIEADVDPRNGPSLHLVEKLGFRREGYLRERYHQEGEWQDSIFLALLAGEWESRRRSPANRPR